VFEVFLEVLKRAERIKKLQKRFGCFKKVIYLCTPNKTAVGARKEFESLSLASGNESVTERYLK
jgi:hypothetical protein